MPKRFFTLILLFFLTFGLITCSQTSNISQSNKPTVSGKFQVWWQQGFYPEETEAIQKLVSQWEKESGTKVELTFFSDKDIAKETENAIAQGKPPDVLFSTGKIEALIPRLAWEGKLADVSEVVEPLKSEYIASALDAVNYQNNQAGKRSYYAVPIGQQAAHIHYWRDLVTTGEQAVNVPTQWADFWKFWETAQAKQRQDGNKEIYGMGLPMSSSASDTYFLFEQFLEAYNVNLVSKEGKLQLDKPENRQGIISALKEYTDFYKQGFVPPQATEWGNPDNNVTFLSRNTIMTINPSLSIPGSQRQDQDTYLKRLVTVAWPDKPNKEALTSVVGIKQVVVFNTSANQAVSKKLLSYIVQPDNLGLYLKGSQGRYFPVMPKQLQDPFWKDPKDPHINAVLKQYQKTRPFPQSFNPAYSEVLAENVWGEALVNILKNKMSPEQAADKAISQIQTIFSNWK